MAGAGMRQGPASSGYEPEGVELPQPVAPWIRRFWAWRIPVAAGAAGQLAAIKAAPGAVVDVLDTGALLELRELQQGRQVPIVAVDDFAVEQQREALVIGSPSGWLKPRNSNPTGRTDDLRRLRG